MDKPLHLCPHCKTPTHGVTKEDGLYFEMCQGCYDYVGSPASQQPGASMSNRFEMERKLAIASSSPAIK